MLKSIFAKLNTAHGIAFPLVLLFTFLAVALLVAGLAPMITTQSRVVAETEDQLIARYAAEAGVKRGLLLARNAYDSLPNGVPPSSIPEKSKIHEKFSEGISYEYSYKYINGSSRQNPTRMEVTATATSKNVTTNSMAWIVFNSDDVPGYISPDLIDLITSANSKNYANCYHWESKSKYNTDKWGIGTNEKGIKYGYPSNGTQENIILFNNNYGNSEFKLDYNLKFTKNSGSGGIGVIYGASEGDTAYDFNAYCIKFNKSREAFSVTKFTTENSEYGNRPVELFINTDEAGPQSYGVKTGEQAMFQPNGSDPYDPNKTSFNGVDNLGNVIGRSSISFDELKKLTGVDPNANNADYSIRIETVWEDVTVYNKDGTSYPDKRLRQNVYLKPANADVKDYVKVLSFIDFSDVNPITTYDLVTKGKTEIENPQIDLERKIKRNKQIRTGLRVWDVKSCEFYNSNIEGDFQNVYDIRQIIWKK